MRSKRSCARPVTSTPATRSPDRIASTESDAAVSPAQSCSNDGRPATASRSARGTVGAHDAADQVVVAGLLDLDLHDLAGPRLAAVDVDLAVDLRRLAHPAAL